MIYALILFAITYVLMLTFSKYRPYIALASAVVFILTGMLPFDQIIGAIDFNVLLMIAGTMGLVQLFIDSRMPARLADMIMEKVPNVQMAAVALALFAGVISASAKSSKPTRFPSSSELRFPPTCRAQPPWSATPPPSCLVLMPI